ACTLHPLAARRRYGRFALALLPAESETRVSKIRKHRLLLVSNRLPVTVRFETGEFVLDRSSGGLASGLATAHDEGDSLWIGWPGEVHTTNATLRRSLDDALTALRIIPVYLNRAEAKGFYEDVSNGVLWPVLHYRI